MLLSRIGASLSRAARPHCRTFAAIHPPPQFPPHLLGQSGTQIYVNADNACPTKHTRAHIGQYYPIPHTHTHTRGQEAATSPLFPEGFAGTLEDEFSHTNAQHLMIRRPAIELFELFRRKAAARGAASSISSTAEKRVVGVGGKGEIEATPRRHEAKDAEAAGRICRRLLLGPRGSGKSATLQHVVHHCRANGWLVLFIPRAHDIGQGSRSTVKRSRTHGDMDSGGSFYDQPEYAISILDQFHKAHGPQLQELLLRGNFDSDTATCSKRKRQALYARYAAAQRAIDDGSAVILGGAADANVDYDKALAATPSMDDSSSRRAISIAAVLEAGLANKRRYATDALVDLRAELSLVEEMPVLVCVDECNWLYEPTAFHYMGAPLMPSQMTIAALFRTFASKQPRDMYFGERKCDHWESLEGSLRPPLNAKTGSFELHAATERHPLRYPGGGYLPSGGDRRKRNKASRREFKRARRNAKNVVANEMANHGSNSCRSFRNEVVSGLPRKLFSRLPQAFNDQEMASCLVHYGLRGVFGGAKSRFLCDYIENYTKTSTPPPPPTQQANSVPTDQQGSPATLYAAFTDTFVNYLGVVTGGVPERVREECVSGHWHRGIF